MRAATLTSLAVLGLSTAALAGVGEGQRTRHHRATDPTSNTMSTNSTDPAMNADMTPPNTMMPPDSTTGNAM